MNGDACAPRTLGAIEGAVETLANSVSALEDAVRSLEATLSPSLLPVDLPPLPPGNLVPVKAPAPEQQQSPLVSELTKTREKIQSLYCCLQGINERCQL